MAHSSRKRLKIAIATAGRFWLLDLARELDALGHEVRLYSYLPRGRSASFGLPERCHVGLLPLVAPLVAWQHLRPDFLPIQQERLLVWALDRAVVIRLKPCDVFICLSGVYLDAIRHAKKQFGARIHLERGSRHILSQREILANICGAKGPSDFAVSRELAGYALADRIVVPSAHVFESFNRDPEAARKLFLNPYGVDLNQFPQRASSPPPDPKTVLFVGGWSYRKGVDVLTNAIIQMPGVNLLHVGGIDDTSFPDHPRFRHHDSVSQLILASFYAQAHVFAIASREEGLAMVQAQALASGLPIVCTDRTGGADLAHSPALAERIRVVPADNVNKLRDGIAETLTEAVAGRFGTLAEEDRQLLSWQAYGKRYSRELLRTF